MEYEGGFFITRAWSAFGIRRCLFLLAFFGAGWSSSLQIRHVCLLFVSIVTSGGVLGLTHVGELTL